MKYVIITGGVTSSLGKGIVAASLGRLLKARDYRVILQKFDPYLNVDPGTMSPYQHGEVFVTEDGAETDLDLGHYERFVDIDLDQTSNVTTGKVYQTILEKERRGDYLGSTVQVIPHVTDEIKKRLYKDDSLGDIVITEIGGTVGDIESLPFLEAARQVKREIGSDNVVYVHVTLLPTLTAAGEVKTKPTQHSVKELRAIGIQPDILICRTDMAGSLTESLRQKIAMFCDVEPTAVIENFNVETVYELPKLLKEEELDTILLDKLKLPKGDSNLGVWSDIGYKFRTLYPSHKTIGIIGKYTQLHDAYISIVEALRHAFLATGKTMKIEMISSEEIEESTNPGFILGVCDGIIIPGGFGERGIEGKVIASSWARCNKVPCFGICLGLQAMVIDILRSAGFDANSTEFDPNTSCPVIHLLENQKTVEGKGGTMRLGAFPCHLRPYSKVREIYGKNDISERHRHRYEVNNNYRHLLHSNGLEVTGASPDASLVEIVERQDHPWFIGCQFHPEFKSRPDKPHPLFVSFVKTIQSLRS